METLAMRIKKFRQLRGLSQKELASQLGVSNSAISQYESSTYFHSEPSVKNLIKMAKIFDVSFEWLATGRGVENIDDYLIGVSGNNLSILSDGQKKLLSLFNKHPKDWQEKYITILESTAKNMN
jgi:transcriptional regulator with XRE-family HTH domain